jgi:hypothetical protein
MKRYYGKLTYRRLPDSFKLVDDQWVERVGPGRNHKYIRTSDSFIPTMPG